VRVDISLLRKFVGAQLCQRNFSSHHCNPARVLGGGEANRWGGEALLRERREIGGQNEQSKANSQDHKEGKQHLGASFVGLGGTCYHKTYCQEKIVKNQSRGLDNVLGKRAMTWGKTGKRMTLKGEKGERRGSIEQPREGHRERTFKT